MKTSKLRVTGLCEENSSVTGEFPAQRASNAENVSIWWRHHVKLHNAYAQTIGTSPGYYEHTEYINLLWILDMLQNLNHILIPNIIIYIYISKILNTVVKYIKILDKCSN